MAKSNRKLAAIVFTDIVGFTELTAENEPAALKLLDTQRNLLKPIVESYNGDWLKEIGDGLLLSFATSHDAVKCSIEIQRKVKSIEKLNLRIGIHQGEVIFQGNDVIGDDVNIAARIEPFSAPGGIAISDRVNVGLERDPDFETSYIGKPDLKGVKQRVEIFCITSHGLPETDISQVSAKLEPKNKSLAKRIVLPLMGLIFTLIGAFVWFVFPLITFTIADDQSRFESKIAVLYLENKGQEENNYVADGLTEEIISRLSKINNLAVASRYDVLGYKGKVINIEEIKNDISPDLILTGNILIKDSQLKIYLELLDIKNRKVVWADSFKENIDNIFSLQDKMAMKIVSNLSISISSSDKASVLLDPASDITMYDELLKIKKDLFEFIEQEDGLDKLIERLNNIIEKDPQFADAIATRGLYYFFQYYHKGYWIDEDENSGKELREAALKDSEAALYLDPKNLTALGNLPTIYMLSLWKIRSTSQKIFTARKAFVHFNELQENYPDNFMTSFARGMYHRIKIRMAALSDETDYDNALKYLNKSLRQMRNGINNESSDPLIIKLYEEGLKVLGSLVDTYNDYSIAIEYHNELINFYEEHKKLEELEDAMVSQIFILLLTGYFEKAIDMAFKLESVSKQNQSKFGQYRAKMYIAKAYAEKGEPEVGIELIENVQKEYFDKMGLWAKVIFNIYKIELLLNNNEYEKAELELENSFVSTDSLVIKRKHNEYHLWIVTGLRMYTESLAAIIYSELNIPTKTQYYINKIENQIPNQPRLYFAYSTAILNNLSISYQYLGKERKALEYKRMAVEEMIKIADKLSKEDKYVFINNIKLNKELNSLSL